MDGSDLGNAHPLGARHRSGRGSRLSSAVIRPKHFLKIVIRALRDGVTESPESPVQRHNPEGTTVELGTDLARPTVDHPG